VSLLHLLGAALGEAASLWGRNSNQVAGEHGSGCKSAEPGLLRLHGSALQRPQRLAFSVVPSSVVVRAARLALFRAIGVSPLDGSAVLCVGLPLQG
jgi:hypothetical protein